MSLSVAIETSTRSPSVALRSGERVLAAELSGQRAHASDLMPALDRLLARAEVGARAIDAVLVGTGPGSYTGLRVGCATALGLALGTGARVRGVPSVEALVFDRIEDGEAGVLLDARAGEVYFARYRRTVEDVETVAAPRVVERGALGPLLPEGLRLFADAAALEAAGVEGRAKDVLAPAAPRAEAVLALGSLRLSRDGPQEPGEVEPLYLRAFAARARRR